MGLSEETREEIVAMLREGISVATIHEETSIGVATIYRIRKSLGIPRADPLADVDVGQLLAEYEALDTPVAQLCKDFGISVNQLYLLLADTDTPMRRGESYREARKRQLDDAVQMYQEGYYYWEITRDTGISQPTVTAELRKRGIPLRRDRNERSTDTPK